MCFGNAFAIFCQATKQRTSPVDAVVLQAVTPVSPWLATNLTKSQFHRHRIEPCQAPVHQCCDSVPCRSTRSATDKLQCDEDAGLALRCISHINQPCHADTMSCRLRRYAPSMNQHVVAIRQRCRWSRMYVPAHHEGRRSADPRGPLDLGWSIQAD